MTTTGEIQRTVSLAGTAVMPAVRQLLLWSFGLLAVQTSLTDYDAASTQPAAVGDIDAAVLSLMFFGQAIPLALRPIRDHVRHAS